MVALAACGRAAGRGAYLMSFERLAPFYRAMERVLAGDQSPLFFGSAMYVTCVTGGMGYCYIVIFTFWIGGTIF